MDRDDPSWTADYESMPENCNVEKYQIKEVSGSTIWNNIRDVPRKLTIEFDIGLSMKHIKCLNKDQPDCPVDSKGWPIGSPIPDKCCKDYEIRACCQPVQRLSKSQ